MATRLARRREIFLSICIGVSAWGPAIAADTDSREQVHSVPVTDARGRIVQVQTRICRPAGDAPATLVIINHGSPANSAERPKMQVGRCQTEAAQWFLSRGYVVAFPLRRGYGETGGVWAEDTGGCPNPDFVRGGLETARDIDAVVNYAAGLPFVRHEGVVVIGQSAGGWGAIAYDSAPHPKVAAFIVMAGGRGGHMHDRPNNNCRPDLLADAAGHFGKTATTPMLWIYTANDSFFAPQIARGLWHSFTTAGGQADLHQLGAYDGDGHHLFFGPEGSKVWGPLAQQYLTERGVAAD
ncbi:MAG TPA: prolyl oligopeptidase family serine peptidase [Steroidobacteraceae bacterium]|nr:prolyl oligopeptidase family serine peptidase [Steroidobacteraceae bacterium]